MQQLNERQKSIIELLFKNNFLSNFQIVKAIDDYFKNSSDQRSVKDFNLDFINEPILGAFFIFDNFLFATI